MIEKTFLGIQFLLKNVTCIENILRDQRRKAHLRRLLVLRRVPVSSLIMF